MSTIEYVKVVTRVTFHPKFQIAGAQASWLWVLGIIYCRNMESDGFIPSASLKALGYQHDNADDAARLLVEAGLWVVEDHGWRVHDYLDYNDSAEQIAEMREQKRSNGAKGGRARAAALRSRVPQRREADVKQGATTSAKQNVAIPDPYPYPDPNKQQASTNARGTSLVQRRRLNAAFEGARVDVPTSLHLEFIRLLNRPTAEQELLKWYGDINLDWSEGEHKGVSTGGDVFAFWRARFSERWPSPPTPSTRKRPQWAIEADEP